MNGNASCWAVADGLGGHSGGKIASQLAVDTLLENFRGGISDLLSQVDSANGAILDWQIARPDLKSMRTTIAALAASAEGASWIHSGDSRLYWFDSGKIAAQTKDHSVPQLLADAGEIEAGQIRGHEDRNRLVRCLGQKREAVAAEGRMPRAPQPGDAFLLITDGFWEWIEEPEMEQLLRASTGAEDWLARMEAALRSRASGAFDNYSAIAVVVREAS